LTIRNSQRLVPVRVPLLRARASLALSLLRMPDYSLDIWLTNDQTIRRLNRQYRTRDAPTDVLSFPFQALQPPAADLPPEQRPLPPPADPAGSVRELGQLVISAPYVARAAKELQVSTDERLRVLMVHGLCHLLGYDHENEADAARMEKEEDRISQLIKQHEQAEEEEKQRRMASKKPPSVTQATAALFDSRLH